MTSKIYTKNGDSGTSSTINTKSIPKSSSVFQAIGAVDEANAWVGLLANFEDAPILRKIQSSLFTIGTILADQPPYRLSLNKNDITELEQEIDSLTEKIPPLTNFILPGDNIANAYAHLCRTIVRRAEREVVSMQNPDLPNEIIIYLNRLSDYFFTLARFISFKSNAKETIWKP